MPSMSKAARLVGLASVAVVVAACGTTVPQTSTLYGQNSAGSAAAGGQPIADGTGPAVTSGDGTTPGDPSTGVAVAPVSGDGGGAVTTTNPGSVASAPGAVGVPVAGSSPTDGKPGTTTRVTGRGTSAAAPKASGKAKATGSAAPQSSAAVGASGRGFSATTIKIGYSDSDVDTYAQTLGVKGISTGDTKAQIQALADYINAHGGIDGRMIQLYEYTYSTASSEANPDSAATTACDQWTQDDVVFAVVSSSLSGDTAGLQCMANGDTPVIDANQASDDLAGEPTYTKYPNILFAPGTYTAEKLAQLYVGMMVRTKFLTGWNTTTGAAGPAPVKIGILVNEEPIDTYAADQIIADLKAVGYTISPSDIVSYNDSLDAATTAASSAVLQFRSDGVTHVVTSDLQFAEAANSQAYYPRYAVSNEPEVFAENFPEKQLVGAVAISSTPPLDTTAAYQPPVQNATQALCEKIMTNAGQDITDLTALAGMEEECDEMFSLANSLNAAGSISNSALQSGFESVGATDCSSTFVCQQGGLPSGHASAQAVRDMTFQPSCTCFTYVDGVNHS